MNDRFKQLWFYWPILLMLPVFVLLLNAGDFTYLRGSSFSDMAITHYPNALWIQQSLKNWGEIPLWSATILSGYPFAADPLSGLWYPPGWVALLFPEPVGLNVCLALHLIWGGLGMVYFLRSEEVDFLPALLGGIAFEAMPKLFGHLAAGHVTLVYAVAWTPWLLRAENLAQPGRWRPGGGWWKTGLCFGMIVLADLRWAALAGLLWAGYAVHRSLKENRQQAGKFVGRIAQILMGIALALLLSGVVILPVYEYTSASTRALMTVKDSLTLSLPPVQLLGIFAPPMGGSAEWILYPGAGILVLVVLGLGLPSARFRIGFWLTVVVVSILFALGSNFPGVDLLVRLPGLNLLRVPPRALLLSGIGLIAAAVFSLQTIIDQPESLKWTGRLNPVLILVGLTFLVLVLAGLGWVVTGKFQPGFSLAGVALAGNLVLIFFLRNGKLSGQRYAVLLTAWLMLDLCLSNYGGIDFRPAGNVLNEGAEAASYLKSQPGLFRVYSPSYSLPQQTSAIQGLELADGVDPLQLLSYVQFMGNASGVSSEGYSVTLPAFQNGEPSTDNLDARVNAKLLGLLNVGFVCAEYNVSAPGLVEIARFGKTRVYRNLHVLPRAWVQDPNSMVGENVLRAASVSETANRVVVDAQGPGLLVLSEITYPGWETWLDGKEVTATSPIGLLRGLDLPAGMHHVEMVFRPTILMAGGLVSGFGWLLVIFFWQAGIRRKG